jgi:hypothetical protein
MGVLDASASSRPSSTWHGGFGPGLMRVAIAALLLGFVLIQRLQQR